MSMLFSTELRDSFDLVLMKMQRNGLKGKTTKKNGDTYRIVAMGECLCRMGKDPLFFSGDDCNMKSWHHLV